MMKKTPALFLIFLLTLATLYSSIPFSSLTVVGASETKTIGYNKAPVRPQLIFEDLANSYRLNTSSFIVEFFKGSLGYDKLYDIEGKELIYDMRLALQYYRSSGQGSWNQRGTPTTVSAEKIDEYTYKVTRYFNDFVSTVWRVEYIVSTWSQVKFTAIINSGQKDTYRLLWSLSGIVNTKNIETSTSIQFKSETTDFGGINIDWLDAYKSLGSITEKVISDVAQGRKLDLTFSIGNIDAGKSLTLDPSFGYTWTGGTQANAGTGDVAIELTSPADMSTVEYMTVYTRGYVGADNVKGYIYTSDGQADARPVTLIASTTATNLPDTTLRWYNLTFSSSVALNASQKYFFGYGAQSSVVWLYNGTEGTPEGIWDNDFNYASPDATHSSCSDMDAAIPLYITYTASGGGDSTAPTYASLSSSTTVAGASCQFNATWTDETDLATTGGYIFSTNNTGSWANDTWTAFTTNPQTVSVSKTLSSTVGDKVQWTYYANDTSNNWNQSTVTTITLTDGTNPTFGAITGNTTVAGAGVTYSCTISDNAGVSGYIASWNNTGAWVNGTWTSGSSGTLTGTHNSTVGNKVSVIFYANDTSNNWGVSSTSTFTLTDGTEPQYSSHSSSATIQDTTCLFNVTITDNGGLVTTGGYIFSTNNTGTWTNETWTAFTSNPQTISVSKTLNSTINNIVQWIWYSNDTSDNWATSTTQSLTISASTSFTVTLTGKTSAALGETIMINFTITRGGYSVSTFKLNITDNGGQTFTNYTQTYMTVSEPSAVTHTFNVTGVSDEEYNVAATPTCSGLVIVWTDSSAGGVAAGGSGDSPDNDPQQGGEVDEPTEPDPTIEWIKTNLNPTQDQLLIGIIIVIVSILVASTLTTYKVKRKAKFPDPTKVKTPKWRG